MRPQPAPAQPMGAAPLKAMAAKQNKCQINAPALAVQVQGTPCTLHGQLCGTTERTELVQNSHRVGKVEVKNFKPICCHTLPQRVAASD